MGAWIPRVCGPPLVPVVVDRGGDTTNSGWFLIFLFKPLCTKEHLDQSNGINAVHYQLTEARLQCFAREYKGQTTCNLKQECSLYNVDRTCEQRVPPRCRSGTQSQAESHRRGGAPTPPNSKPKTPACPRENVQKYLHLEKRFCDTASDCLLDPPEPLTGCAREIRHSNQALQRPHLENAFASCQSLHSWIHVLDSQGPHPVLGPSLNTLPHTPQRTGCASRPDSQRAITQKRNATRSHRANTATQTFTNRGCWREKDGQINFKVEKVNKNIFVATKYSCWGGGRE